MKTILTTLTLLVTQIGYTQIFTQADEIAAFPGCENITDYTQRCNCNQSQIIMLSSSNEQIVQIKLTIDGTGTINKWQTLSSDDSEVKNQINQIMIGLKSNVRLSPARIGGEPVNSEMIILVPINNIEKQKNNY